MSSMDHALPLFPHLQSPPHPRLFSLTEFLVPHVDVKENTLHVFLVDLQLTPQKNDWSAPLSPPPPNPTSLTGRFRSLPKLRWRTGGQLPSRPRSWTAKSRDLWATEPCGHWSGNAGRGAPHLGSSRAAPHRGSQHPGASQKESVAPLSASLPLQPPHQCRTAVFL